jgi:hypothetical protein
MGDSNLSTADEAHFYEMLEKCKDKSYVHSNRDRIRVGLKENRECVMACLGSKRNIPLLKLMERTGVSPREYLPDLEDKKNMNQYVYSTYHYIHKVRVLDDRAFEDVQRKFSCMKNHESMFVDTENLYIINVMEGDRRSAKLQREECNKVADFEEELKMLMARLPKVRLSEIRRMKNVRCDVKAAYAIDVDSAFDLSKLKSRTGDEARSMIRATREEIAAADRRGLLLCNLGPLASPEERRGSERLIERLFFIIDRRRVFDSALLYSIDNLLGNRITRLYAAITALARAGNKVYILSMCPLAQIIAELVFYEYEDFDIGYAVSMKDADTDVLRRMEEVEESRVIYVSDSGMKHTEAEDVSHMGHSTLLSIVSEAVIPELQDGQ